MLRDEKKLVADELLWFAMSTARKPVMKVKVELDAKGIENYVAMQYVVEMAARPNFSSRLSTISSLCIPESLSFRE